MWGISDWGNNYFLLYAARKTGIQGLQAVVASGWVRGAVVVSDFESRDRVLGDFQLQTHRHCFAKRDERQEEFDEQCR